MASITPLAKLVAVNTSYSRVAMEIWLWFQTFPAENYFFSQIFQDIFSNRYKQQQ